MLNEDIRKHNLKLILSEFDQTQKGFAEKVGTSQAYISQILSNSCKGKIGSNLARKIEKAYGKPEGWLDQDHKECMCNIIINKLKEIYTCNDSEQLLMLRLEFHEFIQPYLV